MFTIIEVDSRNLEIQVEQKKLFVDIGRITFGCSEFKSWFIDNCPVCLLLWVSLILIHYLLIFISFNTVMRVVK
jgi:hypothetical protein